MNKRSRNSKGFSRRLLALLLCCFCLVTLIPVTAAAENGADDAVIPAAAADGYTETEPTEPPAEPEVTEEPVSEPAPEAEPSAEPVVESEEEVSAKSETDVLFERLMACASIEEMNAALDALTPDEQALLEQFTEEQNAALEAKVDELGGYAVDVLAGTLNVTNNMTNVDVAYYKIENDVITKKLVAVTSGSAMSFILDNDTYAMVYFVKPHAGYLLTSFYRNNNEGADLYSVETAAKDSLFRYFSDNPDVGDSIIAEAKKEGYLGYFGFTGPSSDRGYTGTFVEVAEAPQMTVSAVAAPNENLKPGDKVTFTITVTPGDLSSKAAYTITDKTITSLTINGVPYTATENEDGTYSVEYEITEADWLAKKATLEVTASLTYNYVLPVKDRNNNTSNIRTEGTVTGSATTDCTFATKQGVLYQLSYNAPSGVNPPLDTSLTDYIPAAPVDNDEYFKDEKVPVQDYDRSVVDDPANRGTWTFTGWTNGDRTDLTAGDKVTKTDDGNLLFTGVWTFTPYPPQQLTIRKTVSGNMQDPNKEFTFTVSADETMTYGEQTGTEFTFQLKKNDQVTITVPVGAEVTVAEDAGGYDYSVGEGTTITGYTESGTGIQFTMPRAASTVEFNNAKNIDVDTGVALDSLPYVLILAVVAAGAVALLKKRRMRED